MTGDVLPVILGIVVVAAAAAFALVPFFRGAPHDAAPAAADGALADRFRLYRQVLELEFDHQVGKLSAADFEQLSTELLAQAGQVLRNERGTLVAIDEEIEREIAAARTAFAAARRATAARAEKVS